MNYKIALDVDDVLAAFTPHAHKFHNKEMDEKIDYWCPLTVEKALGKGWFGETIALDREFWKTIPVLSDPKDIDFEVECYMSSFPEEMYDERAWWLVNHGFPIAPLVCTTNKLETCKEWGITHLVDDKPATIQALQGTEITGIHFITPYCGFEPVGDKIVTNLKQVKQYL